MRAASYSVKNNKPGIDSWQCNSIYIVLEREFWSAARVFYVLMQLLIQKTSMSNITRDLLYVPLFKERAENFAGIPLVPYRTSSPGTGRTQLIRVHVEEYL
jgi:hypothetical protein